MTAAAMSLVASAPLANAAAVARHLRPEEPVFCFSADALVARYGVFRRGFPGLVSYAVKSNPSHEVIETLATAGLTHWDVASVQEMALVRSISPEAVFHYHNPVKSRREIAEAFKTHGCRRFAADCREEVQKIAEVTGNDKAVEIAVRFVLPRERTSSAHDFSTKFGAPEHLAVALLQDVAARGMTPVLTFHPGSQSRDPQVYVRHIEAASRIVRASGVRVGKLNVGGGFPARYPLSTPTAPLEDFFATIADATGRFFADMGVPQLECEPGRGLVASCMSLLVGVKLVCSDGDDIFINDGVYGGLMEFMQVPELQPPFRVFREGEVLDGPVKPWKVFGPTCDPLDVLPNRLDLPEALKEGDYIEFGTLGAYGISTATRFNGYGGHAVLRVETVLQS